MNVIKLGKAFLNMDLVTDVWVNQGRVNVFFAVPAMYSAAPFREVTHAVTTREISFSGAEAAALVKWLASQATDITPGPDAPTDTGVNAGSTDADVDDLPHDTALAGYDSVDDGPVS